jgi:hypothetical protein
VNCSSSGVISRSRASPSTGSSDGATQPGMENVLAQPRAGHCRRWICSLFQLSLCLRRRSARPQRRRLDQTHRNPTAEWVARQIAEAFPWDEAPHYLRSWTNPGIDRENLNPYPAWLAAILPAGGGQRGVRGARRLDAAQIARRPLAPVEATTERAKRLTQRGLDPERAWRSASNGHGP